MKPALSVLFATHNGARWIGRVLGAYAAQDYAGPWQLIIVDNKSTDDTAEIVRSYADRLPLIFLSEPRVGKNRALNKGLRAAEADLIILTDDDAPPEPDFLSSWAKLQHSHLEFDLFGGCVTAEFEVEPPAWVRRLTKTSSAVFAQRHLPTGPIAADEIFGPNMCVRRRVFEGGLTFNENVGPNGLDQNYPMGSETDFCRRAAAAGRRAMFFSEPAVGHIVRPDQMTMAYFKKVAYRAGRRDAIVAAETGVLQSNLWSGHRLRRYAPTWLQRYLLAVRAWSAVDLLKRNLRWWRYNWWRGYMDESRLYRATEAKAARPSLSVPGSAETARVSKG